MGALPRATSVGPAEGADDAISLPYNGRLLRRKRLTTDAGQDLLVDLAEVTNVTSDNALVLEDGRKVAVHAAPEALLKITGDLPRLAWHIGNRHTPCQVLPDCLLIQNDHVLASMLQHLGATVEQVTQPFEPEGGAYGHGRTMGHSHGLADDHHHDH